MSYAAKVFSGGSRSGENATRSSSSVTPTVNVTKNATTVVTESVESANSVSVEETVVIRVAPPKSVTESVAATQQGVTQSFRATENSLDEKFGNSTTKLSSLDETRNAVNSKHCDLLSSQASQSSHMSKSSASSEVLQSSQSTQSSQMSQKYQSSQSSTSQMYQSSQTSQLYQSSLSSQSSQSSQWARETSLQNKSFNSTESKLLLPKFNAQQYHSKNQTASASNDFSQTSQSSRSSFEASQAAASFEAKTSYETKEKTDSKSSLEIKTSSTKAADANAAKNGTGSDDNSFVNSGVKNEARSSSAASDFRPYSAISITSDVFVVDDEEVVYHEPDDVPSDDVIEVSPGKQRYLHNYFK